MRYMFNRCTQFINGFIILIALASSACGRTAITHPPPAIGDHGPAFDFCRRLYTSQSNIQSKQELCGDTGKFLGFDIPGFPPQAGYCGETYGAACYQEEESMKILEDCVAMMPVCVPERANQWVETWRKQCISLYNSHVQTPGCRLREIHSGQRFYPMANDEE
jgi:hypothetical protein